jgi:hypothetical protein
MPTPLPSIDQRKVSQRLNSRGYSSAGRGHSLGQSGAAVSRLRHRHCCDPVANLHESIELGKHPTAQRRELHRPPVEQSASEFKLELLDRDRQ